MNFEEFKKILKENKEIISKNRLVIVVNYITFWELRWCSEDKYLKHNSDKVEKQDEFLIRNGENYNWTGPFKIIDMKRQIEKFVRLRSFE